VLPADHLAWFVLAVLEDMDLTGFYAAYRRDGHGRAAHDPAMMVALLLYGYATERRSSRAIERACVDGVAFRLIAAIGGPDHCTIARFRQRHEAALAGLFGEVLALCADAGLAGVAVLAVDGTKVRANASQHQNLDYDEIAREILAELVIAAYIFADGAAIPRPGPQGKVSDAELVALALCQATVGIPSDRQFLGLVERLLPGWVSLSA
jgi:transposase